MKEVIASSPTCNKTYTFESHQEAAEWANTTNPRITLVIKQGLPIQLYGHNWYLDDISKESDEDEVDITAISVHDGSKIHYSCFQSLINAYKMGQCRLARALNTDQIVENYRNGNFYKLTGKINIELKKLKKYKKITN